MQKGMQKRCHRMELEVDNLSLYHTLECGQAFRWKRTPEGSYYGIEGEDAFILHQKGNRLKITTTNKSPREWATRYLALDIELAKILKEIDRDEHIHTAIESCKGLRVLRQNPWETLASFILSSNNSIPNIQRMIENLSLRLGRRIELEGLFGFSFPSPQAIAANRHIIDTCRLGFRCDYLVDAAEAITKGDIDLITLKGMEYEELRERLMGIRGVGPKISDCVALFAFGKYESFPIDVWIKRTMQWLYFKDRKVSDKKIWNFGREHFGRFCGYAQEYLYCHFRMKQ